MGLRNNLVPKECIKWYVFKTKYVLLSTYFIFLVYKISVKSTGGGGGGIFSFF